MTDGKPSRGTPGFNHAAVFGLSESIPAAIGELNESKTHADIAVTKKTGETI
jgi:hypothetical protein